MGRPYDKELKELSATYNWALSQDVSKIQRAIKDSADLPILSVASGGAYAAANILAHLHSNIHSTVSRAVTPYELVGSLPADRALSVWLLSASGRNIDIQRAFGHSLNSEARQLTTLCLNPSSPLSSKSEKAAWPENVSFRPPFSKDGFLATNSLLAITVLIIRAYLGEKIRFPSSLEQLLTSSDVDLKRIQHEGESVWLRKHIAVIFGRHSKHAALDIESRFTEAGLSTIQPADFRNFAHGRHHWLAKHESDSAVLSIYNEQEDEIADRTLALIPESVPRLKIRLCGEPWISTVASIVASIHIAGHAGNILGIDPGRPKVPSFGRKLYNLRADSGHQVKKDRHTNAIERKMRVTRWGSGSKAGRDTLEKSLNQFRKGLRKATYPIIVSDYDGTIVDTRFKTAPPGKLIVSELKRLLSAGIKLGIATGRGDSVRDNLRSFISEEPLRERVWVGYYNCAQIGCLNDDSMPIKSNKPIGALGLLNTKLQQMDALREIAEIKPSRDQITIIPKEFASPQKVYEIAEQCTHGEGLKDIALARSGHSVDIVDRTTSKLNIFSKMREVCGQPDGAILTFGDRGRWPGNDYALLSNAYSLSVDEVSTAPDSCWNLAPIGVRGPNALQFYLRRLDVIKDRDFVAARFRNL